VKNVTVSVPDEVYRAARIRAAEQGTSLSALVAEHLRTLAGQGDAFSTLEARQEEIRAGIRRFRAADGLSREELHERAVR
jgi:plasmid stability protein